MGGFGYDIWLCVRFCVGNEGIVGGFEFTWGYK